MPAGPSDRALESQIRSALGAGELSLAYQPELDLRTRRVLAVEALLRWQHPEHGELGPSEFIALAERSDLIQLLGAWVVDESVGALAGWLNAIPDLDVVLRVNVSPVQLTGDRLVDLLAGALDRHGVPGRRICVELTETAPLPGPAQVASTLQRLARLGVRSAIDDLGTGYSTLSQLRALPVDVIKLDRTLVFGVNEDERGQAIIRALVGLARDLRVELVAEGVETAAEAECLLRLGLTRAQGHHLGRPAPAADVLALLRERGISATRNS